MDLIDKLNAIAANIPRQMELIQTEEATKNAWVMPFINALGYNVFDPTEVVPELTADVGVKKGEKVDYAVMKDGAPIMLIECKCQDSELDKEHASQLYRYFTVTKARFGVLTNGILYRFFTDLEEPNKMDSKPFLEFNMLDIREQLVDELKKFSKSSFDIDQILATASELKYTKEIKRLMNEQFIDPSEEFVRFFTVKVYPGRMTQAVKEQFTGITKRALQQFVSEKISDRLKTALAEEITSSSNGNGETLEGGNGNKPNDIPNGQLITTTQDELEGYYVVKSILRDIVDVNRVAMRDAKTYCGILLDDNNRKPICRLWFNGNQKYVGLFDQQKQEQKYPVEDINDIYAYAEQLRAAIGCYEHAPVS